MGRVEAIENAIREGLIEVPGSTKEFCKELLRDADGEMAEAFADVLRRLNGQVISSGDMLEGSYVLDHLTKIFYGLVAARMEERDE